MLRHDFSNRTQLDTERLRRDFADALAGWAVGRLAIRVRYSRSADFSGTCFYREQRIHVNLGRHVRYPYLLRTHIGRARTVGRSWCKPAYAIELVDGHELVLFVFLHELYHLLVKRARRNTRQKESMCDRFATRYLVDRLGARVRDQAGGDVPRQDWDFQDVEGFVDAARDRRSTARAARRPLAGPSTTAPGDQGLLFQWAAEASHA